MVDTGPTTKSKILTVVAIMEVAQNRGLTLVIDIYDDLQISRYMQLALFSYSTFSFSVSIDRNFNFWFQHRHIFPELVDITKRNH